MTDLAFTILRLGFLALLWLMVFAVVATLRKDIYGTVVTPRGKGRAAKKSVKESRKRANNTAGAGETPNHLLVTGGPLTGTLLSLHQGSISIGRSPSSTLVLDDRYASSNHATLTLQGNGWVLTDLGSTNGTYVDEERLAGSVQLRPGATVRIGQTTFELVK